MPSRIIVFTFFSGENDFGKSLYLKKSVDVLNDCDEQKLHDCHVCFVRLMPSAVVNALAIAYSCTKFCTLAFTRWQHGCTRVAVPSRAFFVHNKTRPHFNPQFQSKTSFSGQPNTHTNSSNTTAITLFGEEKKNKFQLISKRSVALM